MHSIHRFKVEGISGENIDLVNFQGKKMMIVNVASECGFTPQYRQLQELYEHYKDQLVIIGFPSNDFGGQEPGTEENIKAFCELNYGVSFPLTAKVSIKGNDVHPVYKWLTHANENGVRDTKVQWNFHKFLLDEAGHLHIDLPSVVTPLDEQIIDWLGE